MAAGVLILVFLCFAIWYMATHQAPSVFAPGTATSTASAAAPITSTVGPQQIADHGQYYDITASYPGSTVLKQTSDASADAAAVLAMKTFLQQEADRFKSESNLDAITSQQAQIEGIQPGEKYVFNATYTTYQGSHTVTYVYLLSEDTLGAHPNAYYKTFTFDTTTGQQLALGDIFTPSAPYLQTLSTQARADLPAIINAVQADAADTSIIAQGTTPTTDSFANWYIDGKNLVLLFPPYQVGPYSVGTILDPIPLSKIMGALKQGYR